MPPAKKIKRRFFHFNLIFLLLVIFLAIGLYFGVRFQNNIQQRTTDNTTIISSKPRDKAILYRVKSGDSLVSLGEQFGISVNTIKWANNLTNNEIEPGQELQIAPESGIIHTVEKGDTISSVAAKYKTTSQNIKNFIFNEYKDPSTFELTPGQTLYVPDGVKE